MGAPSPECGHALAKLGRVLHASGLKTSWGSSGGLPGESAGGFIRKGAAEQQSVGNWRRAGITGDRDEHVSGRTQQVSHM